jgi:cell division protein FtsW (lipid II flippase)
MAYLKDVFFGFVGVALTILWEFIFLSATKPLEADSDPNQVFRVQGDLLIVALSVVMGAHFAAATKAKRGELNPAFCALVVALLVIVGLTELAGRSYGWVKDGGEWLSIWIPFGIGALTLLVCIHFAQKAK